MLQIGNPNAPFWIVLDYPSRVDANRGALSFAGEMHIFLGILEKIGITLDECFFCAIYPKVPPKNSINSFVLTKTAAKKENAPAIADKFVKPELMAYIEEYQDFAKNYRPKVKMLLGSLCCWATSLEGAVSSWRGSELQEGRTTVIPAFSFHTINARMDWKFIFMQDFRRAKSIYEKGREVREDNFIIKPTFNAASNYLRALIHIADTKEEPLLLGVDVETANRRITCVGIARSSKEAICIPLKSTDKPHYFTVDEQVSLRETLRKLLTHPNVETVGQNFNYDCGKFAYEFGFIPNTTHDTMLAWHTLYPGMPKDLGFIASMVLPNYVYWKEEGKGHDPKPEQQQEYWIYNAKDAARTLELIGFLLPMLESSGLLAQYQEQCALLPVVTRMEMRGVLQDQQMRERYRADLMFRLNEYDTWFESLTKELIGDVQLTKSKKAASWWTSNPQLNKIFYQIYKLKPRWSRTNKNAKGPSVDDDALKAFAKDEPVLGPLCQKLQEYRSMSVFLSTFVNAKLEYDRRLRTSYGIGATETFRFTSGKYDFIFGANLQNIPSGNEE